MQKVHCIYMYMYIYTLYMFFILHVHMYYRLEVILGATEGLHFVHHTCNRTALSKELQFIPMERGFIGG